MNKLEINDLHMKFKNVHALKGINVDFKENQITGLIGFNGSGKTTTFNIITDLLVPSKGDITFNGKEKDQDFYKSIVYVNASEASTTKNPTRAIEEIKFYGFLYGLSKEEMDKKIDEFATLLDCKQYLKTSIHKLSKGNKQKMRIISAFLNPNMKVLLLDEPFDGLDPLIVERLKKYIISISKEKTVIITSHRMDIVDDICDAYYILKEGEIVESVKDKNERKEVKVEINYEVDIKSLKSKKYVNKIMDDGKTKSIIIKSIDDYKTLTKDLLTKKGYVYHTIRKTTAQDAFLERYQ